jgi:hypothetical protein
MADNRMAIVNTNLALPVDNQSFTFTIPPDTSDYTQNFGTRIPVNKDYYRWISDITYRVDTSGIQNITTTQTVVYIDGSGTQTVVIEPGFYDLTALNTVLTNVIKPITVSGPGAFHASTKAGVVRVALTAAPQIAAILNWPTIVTAPYTGTDVIDLTQSKDLMLVYASFARQSSDNNLTNVLAIPIMGPIGNVVNGNFHSKTPLIHNLDVVDSVQIRLRTVKNEPFSVSTPVFLNFKVLFAEKK